MGRFANTVAAGRAVWSLVASNAAVVVIRDDDGDKSITNDVRNVVAQLAPALRGRRLFYIDTAGRVDEIVVRDGAFAYFAPGYPSAAEFGDRFFSTDHIDGASRMEGR